jgi:hypothetical protein
MTTAFPNAQAALAFVTDQTYNIATTVERAEYPEIDLNDLVVIETAGDPWANGITTYTLDGVGQARWYNGGSNTMPMSEIQKGRTDFPFDLGALGYEFNLEEVNKARIAGINISDEKAYFARQGAEQFIYYVGLLGDALTQRGGLINNPGIVQGNAAAVGTGNSAVAGTPASILWANKTPEQVLADLNGLIVAPYNASNQILMADTVLMPFSAWQSLTIRVLPNTSQTLLDFILKANAFSQRTGQPLKIRGLRELETAGAGGTRRMIAYARNGRVAKFHMPMPFQFQPVWQNGPINWMVPGLFRIGGTDWIRPASATYADGF